MWLVELLTVLESLILLDVDRAMHFTVGSCLRLQQSLYKACRPTSKCVINVSFKSKVKVINKDLKFCHWTGFL